MTSIFNRTARIGLVSLLGFAEVGCQNYYQYHFNGKIGDELVDFSERGFFGDKNELSVVRKNGALVEYKDVYGNDLRVDAVRVRDSDIDTTYTDEGHLWVAQGDFDRYLQIILEVKDSTKKLEETK